MPKVVDHDARRRDFIKAAYETITENGLANTTVRAVARKAGYTTGALFGSLPVAFVYSFFVEYYVSGMTGSVKE